MKKTIAVFVADPYCSVQSSNGIIRALGENYNFKIFSKNKVEDNFFDTIDIVAVPGGFGDADNFDRLFQHNKDSVKKFVHQGGAYLGICMGAYWAGKHYFNILDKVNAVQYIKRPNTDTCRPHAKAIDITWKNNKEKMFFYDGCALIGEGTYTTVASYANGDPMAIIQRRVGLIGCHPESEQFWYDSYSWMNKHWHHGRHHRLLLDFTNSLVMS
jgi:glutamine amidotransferase-like uncharacterized protein